MKSTFVIPFVSKHTSCLQKMETEQKEVSRKEQLHSKQVCSGTVDKLKFNCCDSEHIEQVLSSATVQNIKEVVKLVHCRKHLSIALMQSGELILLCPSSSKLHGRRVTVSDLASFSSCVEKSSRVNKNSNNNFVNTDDKGAMESGKHNTNNTVIEAATVNTSASPSFSVDAATSHFITKGTSSACTESIIDVAAGDAHVVCCTSHGKCYSFGFDNMYGQLGDGTVWTGRPPIEYRWEQIVSQEEEYEVLQTHNDNNNTNKTKTHDIWLSMPHAMLLNVPVKQVSCGSEHTLLLSTACNAVYACGRGDCGQLGNIYNTHIHKSRCNSSKKKESLCKLESLEKGEPVLLQPRPKLIRLLFGLPIQSVVACNSHNFVLLATHKLLVFGDNTFGQLGLGHTHQILTPTSVKVKHNRLEIEELEIDKLNNVSATDANELQSSKCAKRILDAKLFNSLRAPYDTNLSVYYPLTISRISEECNRNDSDHSGECDICVDAVWCGETLTVIRTCDGEWMSCGLAPRRSWYTIHESFEEIESKEQCYHKFDCSSPGVLGRMLTEREHAYYFAPMQISQELEMAYRKHVQMYFQSSEEIIHQSKPATKQKFLSKDEKRRMHGKDNSYYADVSSCNHFANNVSASSWMHIICHPQALLFWLVPPKQVEKIAKKEITNTKNVNGSQCTSCNNDNTFNSTNKCTNESNSEQIKVWLQSNTIVPIVALDKCVKHLLDVYNNNNNSNDDNTDGLYHRTKTNCTSFVLPSHSCILSCRNCALVQAM